MADEQKPASKVEVKDFKKNKMFGFPKNILDEVDRRIQKGHKADMIRKYVTEAYRGELAIPNRKTIAAYIRWRKEHVLVKSELAIRIRREVDYTESELRNMLERLNVAGMDISNRKQLLEKMILFLLTRTQIVSQVQDNVMMPQFEQVIIAGIAETHKMLKTVLELEGEIGSEHAVARLICEKFLTDLGPIVHKAASDTFGSAKLKEFLDRLQRGYKVIDFERLRAEAVLEIAALEKGGHGGKETRADAA